MGIDLWNVCMGGFERSWDDEWIDVDVEVERF